MQDLLRRVVDKKASDLFITAGFPPAIKIDGEVRPQSERALTAGAVRGAGARHHERPADQGIRRDQGVQFRDRAAGIGRFRVNTFVQQGQTGCVIRLINSKIPTLEELDLPPCSRKSCCRSAAS
jgi:twitching motility protein PilU